MQDRFLERVGSILKKKKKATVKRRFELYRDSETPQHGASSGGQVLLYPFRYLSVQPFSFPFSGMSKVRDALKIQFRPLLGERAEDVSFVPFLTKSDRKTSQGAIFLLGREEGIRIDEREAGEQDVLVWPLPLAFASEVEGSGLIVWTDGKQIISLLLRDWAPTLYRWSDSAHNDVEREKEIMAAYTAERGEELSRIFVADEKNAFDIQRHGSRTLAAYPDYEHLDLSNRSANLQERREKTVGVLMRGARIALASGLVFALACAALYFQRLSIEDATPSFVQSVYASAFGEQSRQPLVSVKEKLASLENGNSDTSIQGILKALGGTWDELSKSEDIVIETMRYSQEKTDILGTAKDNNSIARLRALLEERGFSHKTDNIQQIPGGGLRFNLSIARGGRSR